MHHATVSSATHKMKRSYLPTIKTGSVNPIKGHSMIFVLASQNGARALGQRIHVGKSCRKVENTGVVVPRKSHVQQKTASKNAKKNMQKYCTFGQPSRNSMDLIQSFQWVLSARLQGATWDESQSWFQPQQLTQNWFPSTAWQDARCRH